ncbi:MAG: ergothioneine biosynthesis protein EgtB [Bacteroidales bacterium]|nr:ergothioneine biosynthesis protein EgtB [Bacteroidales bacterium]
MSTSISDRFIQVRKQTLKLIAGLHPEDSVVQPLTDVSPPKWHLAHTTWFFENFILKKFSPGFNAFHPEFDYLFNSYYEGQGTRVKRDMRGFHPRPLLNEVLEYRNDVESKILKIMPGFYQSKDFMDLMELGIQHEQQHQELLITDLKFIWGFSPLHPVYKEPTKRRDSTAADIEWLTVDEGIYETGFSGNDFHFDNESPRHKNYIQKFAIASRPVNVAEYLEFIEAGGYRKWQYWLHEGWQWIRKNEIMAPEYWEKVNGVWHIFTLDGFRELDPNETLTHISFYEADAFARWKDFRLPTEHEWEVAANLYGQNDESFNLLEAEQYHPTIVKNKDRAFTGQVWEWTNSAYLPYPGFKPWDGEIAEYNGKFMISQMVLRGGSCLTPMSHIRLSYRNFFHPWLRWQFTGIRLAKD